MRHNYLVGAWLIQMFFCGLRHGCHRGTHHNYIFNNQSPSPAQVRKAMFGISQGRPEPTFRA